MIGHDPPLSGGRYASETGGYVLSRDDEPSWWDNDDSTFSSSVTCPDGTTTSIGRFDTESAGPLVIDGFRYKIGTESFQSSGSVLVDVDIIDDSGTVVLSLTGLDSNRDFFITETFSAVEYAEVEVFIDNTYGSSLDCHVYEFQPHEIPVGRHRHQ
jgi:hypothetical protein